MSEEALDTSTFVSGEQTEGVSPPADPAPADPAPAPNEGEGGAEAPVEETAEVQEEKKRKTAQDRIDEITRARREAEREAKYWRDVAMGKVQPEQNHQQPEGPKAPDPNAYEMGDMDPRYQSDLVDYKVEVRLSKAGLDNLDEKVAQSLQHQAAERVWEARQDEVRSEFADYDEKVYAPDPVTGRAKWPCTQDMAAAIRESDAGGRLAYHLASNPEEARRIAALTPHSQIRELGRLEATLAPASAAKPQAKTATDAPKPATGQVRGAGGQFSPSPETDDFKAFESTFAAKWG